jgi:hypothetical protein
MTLVVFPALLSAQVFNGGVPVGYVCTGTCGVSPANGVVTLAPGGGSQFGWVSTATSTFLGNPLGVTNSTNGSTLLSDVFTATVGQPLSFRFNYLTSDGSSTFPDYAFVELLGGGSPVVLFTAQTTPSGNTVPGFALPIIAPGVTLTPSTTPIIAGAPDFAPLGSSSGTCFDVGCGYTGWIGADYLVPTAGNYQLEFGVFNVADQNYQSALGFDFATGAGGTPVVTPSVTATPEPATMSLVATGLLGLWGAARRRRNTTNAA